MILRYVILGPVLGGQAFTSEGDAVNALHRRVKKTPICSGEWVKERTINQFTGSTFLGRCINCWDHHSLMLWEIPADDKG